MRTTLAFFHFKTKWPPGTAKGPNLLGQITTKTTQWLSRTVMVQNNDVEGAMQVLNGIMANEGMLKRWKLTRRYEKPTWARNRINFERSKAIYDEDMGNRISLMLRKNRKDPYPGNSC